MSEEIMTPASYIDFKAKNGTVCTVEGGGGYCSINVDERRGDYDHPYEGVADVELSREDATSVILFLEAAFSEEETT